jgi:hypothetical protein
MPQTTGPARRRVAAVLPQHAEPVRIGWIGPRQHRGGDLMLVYVPWSYPVIMSSGYHWVRLEEPISPDPCASDAPPDAADAL